MTMTLPKPVAEYFAAANTDDAERCGLLCGGSGCA
jgi:hypothetical protein